jgi:anti-anti-sigma factor
MEVPEVPASDFQIHDGLLLIQQKSEGERIRLSLSGEMDLANADTAASILSEALGSGKSVLVDLAKLEFLDSTGLAMLVEAMRMGGEQLSFMPSEHAAVRRLLRLTGLDERMNLASVKGRPRAEETKAEPLLPAA